MSDRTAGARPAQSRLPDRWTINVDRAVEALDQAILHYRNSIPPYNQPHWVLPEDSIDLPCFITSDKVVHARFFFWASMFMRGRIKSVQAMQRMLKLVEGEKERGNPDILDPFVAVTLPEEQVASVLATYGLYGSFARGWQINARRLIERCGGDVLLLIKDVTIYDQACRVFCNTPRTGAGFWGFQKKMTSMVLYYLIDAGLIPTVAFPPPVDWHHISLAWRLGIINLNGNILGTKEEVDLGCCEDLRDVYMYYLGLRPDVTPVELSRAPWLHSAYLCMAAPGNDLFYHGEYGARSTEADYRPPDWDNPKTVETWLQTCAICPLRWYCSTLAPSSQWYDWGMLGAISTPRTEPTAEQISAVVLFNPHELGGNHARPKAPKPEPTTPEVDLTQPLF